MKLMVCMGAWGLLAVVVIGFMNYVIEKRGESPYVKNKNTIAALAVLLGISIIAGYAVWSKAVSVVAGVRLGITYFGLLGAAVIDWKLHIIPNFIPGSMVFCRLAVLIYQIFMEGDVVYDIISSIVGMILCVTVLMIADKISHGGIGKGDIKLLAAIGFMCGVSVVFETLFLSLVCCSTVSVMLVVLKKCTMKAHLAFGPFLYIGYVGMVVFL